MCECLTIRSSFFGKVAEPLNNCIAYGSSSYAQIKKLDCFRISGGFYKLKMSIFGSSFAKEMDHVKLRSILISAIMEGWQLAVENVMIIIFMMCYLCIS